MRRARVDEDQINEACEQHLRDVLASQVRQLEAMGMGHIDYACRARDYIRQFDASEWGEAGPQRRVTDRRHCLRLVQEPAS